ncbi:hypothetical protein BaRGS_00017654 [Batillaria attramentaria]|uniref:BTB domain-containing protein n=1 Tax=Batillaria attramentaria TaxID=370345 RepID=A0ABD0KV99_9CAEN
MRYADGTQEQETFRHGVETTFFASGHKQGEGLSSLPEFHNQSHADATCDNSDEATETGNVTLGCGKQNTSIQVDRTRNFEQSRDAIDESTDEQGEVTPLVHDAGEGIGGETGERPSRRRRRLLKFNIGGTIFQTEEETVFDTDTTGVRLADRDFVNGLYDPDLDEYFLDRDPEVFRSILNFLRSGKLHIPSTMCGPQVKEELAYWGVSEIHIEPCCWHTFNSWNSTMDSLKQLERDSKLGTLTNRDEQPMTCRRRVWRTLTDPSHSRLAKIYGWVALLFVMAAIFSFVVSTHSAFRVPLPQGRSRPQPPHYHLLLNNSSSISSPSPDNVTTPAPSTTAKAGSVSDFLEETEAHPALWYLDIGVLDLFQRGVRSQSDLRPQEMQVRDVVQRGGGGRVGCVPRDYVEFIVAALDPEQINSGQFMLFIPFLRLMRAFRIFRLIRHVPGFMDNGVHAEASYKDLSLMLIFLLVGTLLFASVNLLPLTTRTPSPPSRTASGGPSSP